MSNNKGKKQNKNTNNLCDGGGSQITDRLSPTQIVTSREQNGMNGHPDRGQDQGENVCGIAIAQTKITTMNDQNLMTSSTCLVNSTEREEMMQDRVPVTI